MNININTMGRAFVPVNTDLFNNPKYFNLDMSALVLYSIYEQRQQVSQTKRLQILCVFQHVN